MSRTHKLITAIAAALWALAVTLMLVPLDRASPGTEALLRIGSVNVAALAACITTVAVLPWLLRDFYKAQMTDYMGSFLAGWAAAHEPEDGEGATVTELRSVI